MQNHTTKTGWGVLMHRMYDSINRKPSSAAKKIKDAWKKWADGRKFFYRTFKSWH